MVKVGRRTRRALTLFEILLAVALIVALTGVLFVFMRNLLSTREAVAERAEEMRAASLLIDRLERDLTATLVGEREAGAGVAGSGEEIRVLTRAVPASLAERGVDDPSILADLQRTEFRFDRQSRELLARRVDAIGEDEAPPEFTAVSRTLGRVRFRYHDGRGWRDEFDSLAANRLPVAVEVAVWYEPWPGEEPAPSEREASEEPEPERETFDPDAVGFDETAAFAEPDAFAAPEPMPDRVRVIVVPDAAAGEVDSPASGFASTEPAAETDFAEDAP